MCVHPRIIFFDGVCNLCSDTVQFIILKDKKGRFKFSSLQSDIAQQLLAKYDTSKQQSGIYSIIYLKNGECYFKSTAVLSILKDIGGCWQFLYLFIIVPRPIRDFVYNVVANNRYLLGGRKRSCIMPTHELKSRFLNES